MKTEKTKAAFLLNRYSDSISKKYSWGYFFILLSAFFVFIFSFINSQIVSDRYEQEINDLLSLNHLYVSTQTIQNLSTAITIVENEKIQLVKTEIANVRETLQQIYSKLEDHYIREVIDFCCTVETYLDQTEEMVDFIVTKRSGEDALNSFDILNLSGFKKLKKKAEETNSYITKCFQDVYLANLHHTEEAQSSIANIRLIMNLIQILIMLNVLWLCLFFLKRVVRGISKSISQLAAFTKDFSENPATTYRVTIATGDEIQSFAESFNKMVDQIQTQITLLEETAHIKEKLAAVEMENLRVICDRKSSELKFLHSQINYHFLFNSLNMIVQTAILEEAPDTAYLLTTIAEILRYNLGKLTTTVSLSDELENIKKYLIIQQYRFDDRLSVDINIENQCLRQQLPCMILQPLIENAVTHGIGPKVEGGQIRLRIFHKKQLCCIEIEDNGVGIPDGKLEQIKKKCLEKSESSSSIGIKNVYKRLVIFYQQDIGFDILSSPSGTLIRIELPVL